MFVKPITMLAIASHFQSSAAWWDNGHMLVGEVANQLLDPLDRETLEAVLNEWESEFPNTNRVCTAAVWPDLIKCSTSSPHCATPALPSVGIMEDWHYMNLPANQDGYKWHDREADLKLFKASFGGHAVDVLESSFKTFNTTQSTWAANFMLRNLIHLVGDVHLPVHTIGGVSERFPKGDLGGTQVSFVSPCPSNNLHALWDAAGGIYTNNWAPQISYEDELRANATKLVKLSKNITDPLNIDELASLSYSDFAKKMVKDKMVRKIILDTYTISEKGLYTKLDLTFRTDNKVPCPSAKYFNWVQKISKKQIALGGRRLSVMLKQIAEQIRTLNIPSSSDKPKPTENPTKPTQNPTKPTQNPNKPTQNPDKPRQNPGKPTQNPDKPKQKPAGKTTDMPAQPSGDKPTRKHMDKKHNKSS